MACFQFFIVMVNYIHIGKIVATHGIGGELIVVHSLGKKNAFKHITTIYVEETKNSYIPYFIEKCSPKSTEETLLKIEEINAKEQAHRFIKKNIWITQVDFDNTADKKYAITLLQHVVFDHNKELGVVEEVIEQPHQLLLKIIYKGKEVFIPLHEETLIKINKNKKEIYVELPDGLLDIYLEN